jgi:uncharacterized iron-regulated protein
MSRFIPGLFFSMFLTLLTLSACTAPNRPTMDPERPYPPERPPGVGDYFHVPTGLFLAEDRVLEIIADYRVIHVGETHDNPASHRLQRTIVQTLADRYPSGVALGMEMFTPAQQATLDRWVAGELTEREFLKQSRWYSVWRMDFDYYRDLLLLARDRKIPVIGLNADKDLVRAVGSADFSELPEEQRALLPEIDLTDPYQRAMTEAVFGGHAESRGGLDGFLRVQNLWDETMAENAARFLDSPQGDGMRLVIVAGSNHVRYGFGIPRRLFRRVPTSYVLIGTREIDIPESKQDRLMDVEHPGFPMPPFDIIAFTAYEDLAKEEVKLGVHLMETDEGVVIGDIVPGSAAEEAGLQKNDVVIRFGDDPVEESFDIVYGVKQKRPGDRAALQIERDGELMDIEVSWPLTAPDE